MKRKYDKAHKDWAKAIKERDNGCVINDNCSSQLQSHHLIPWNIEKHRYNIKNGICLCARHHSRYGYTLSPHNHASLLFWMWMMENRPELLKWVQEAWNEI